MCHVNLLKPYLACDDSLVSNRPVLLACAGPEEEMYGDVVLQPRLKNSETLARLESVLEQLDETKRKQLIGIIHAYPGLFADTPTCTNLIEHDVDVGDARPITQRFYRVIPEKRHILDSEVDYMLENGLAVPSTSSWSSPCILVQKPDSTFRPCTDFGKVNAVTKPDSFPLPRMDDCIDLVGSAKYVSKFDLLKVPLSARAREICSFVTPSGLYSYTVMPFGLRNAPATFQRLMNKVARELEGCAVYLDDVVLFSETWEDHLECIKALFDRLLWAQCEFAKATDLFRQGGGTR